MFELDLSCGPAEVDVAQVGQKDYHDQARRECRAWFGQLKRLYGDHENLRLHIKTNPHDYGGYLSVVGKAYCDESRKILMNMENGDSFWDKIAETELSPVKVQPR